MIQVAGAGRRPRCPLRPTAPSFDMDAFRAAITPATKLIVLNSPANPTGGVMPSDDVEEVAAIATENDAWVLTDEISQPIGVPSRRHPGSAPSVFSIPGMRDRTVLVDGFSKTYCMTGWRLGWAVMPGARARRVELLVVHSVRVHRDVHARGGTRRARGTAGPGGRDGGGVSSEEGFRGGALNDDPGVVVPGAGGGVLRVPDVSSSG